MKAVILAGGFGTRMRPLTYTTPKPLLPLLNKPLIQHIIDSLPQNVDEIIIAANYKIDRLRTYFENRSDKSKTVKVVDEPEPRGTAGAIKNVEEYLEDTFIVINSDIISSLDFKSFLEFYQEKEGLGAISAWSVEDPTEFGVMDIDKNSKILEFQEKPKRDEPLSNRINAGHYILEPEVLDMIPADKKVSIEHEIFPKLASDRVLYAYEFDGHWIDCGRPSSLFEATKTLLDLEDKKVKIDNRSSVEAERRGYITIGKNCEIDQSRIEDSIIFDGATIEEGCEIKNSILGFDVKLEKDVTIKDSIIGDGNILKEKSEIIDEKLEPEVEKHD